MSGGARQLHLKCCPAPVSKLTVSTGQIDRLPPDKITSVSCTSHAKPLTSFQVVSPSPAGQKHLTWCLAPARPGLRLPFRSSHRLLPDKITSSAVLHRFQSSPSQPGRVTVSCWTKTPLTVSCTSHAKPLTSIQVVSPSPAGQNHLTWCLAPASPGLRLPFRSSHRFPPGRNSC